MQTGITEAGSVTHRDKNNVMLGTLNSMVTANFRELTMNVNNRMGWRGMAFVAQDDGYSYCKIPTPDANATEQETVNAAWIRNYVQSVLNP